MITTKTTAETTDKGAASPVVTQQPKGPEKASGPQQISQAVTASSSPPPSGAPSVARSAELLTKGSNGIGAAPRAQMMRSLQRSVGNARVSNLIGRQIQTKLSVGAADDPQEREADRVAETVTQPGAKSEQTVARQIVMKYSLARLANVQSETKKGQGEEPAPAQATQAALPSTVEKQSLNSSPIQRKCDCPGETSGGTCTKCEGENQAVQRQAAPENSPAQSFAKAAQEQETSPPKPLLTDAPKSLKRQAEESNKPDAIGPSVGKALNSSGGRPLDHITRTRMESAFGNEDFSGVRIHTSRDSEDAAKEVQAKAFTTGQDIHFAKGEFQPATTDGDKLLAHELTHVVQQEQGPVSGVAADAGLSISHPSDPHEQEASQRADTVMRMLESSADQEKPASAVIRPKQLINRAFLQREVAESAPVTPAELIKSYTNMIGNLDEEGLGQDLANRLPAQSVFVFQVFNLLSDRDQDDVAYVIASGSVSKIPTPLRMVFVGALVTGVVDDKEEEVIANIWRSFERETELPKVAEQNRDLWKQSLWESDQLVAYIKPTVDAFAVDVRGLARAYLAGNKQALFDEANRYGIDLKGQKSITPTKTDYLKEVRAMVPGVLKLQKYLEQLKEINVGYSKLSDCMAGDCKIPATFNPEHPPMLEPDGEESPKWPKWGEVKVHYDRTSALISAFASHYPSIYLLIQQDNLEALSKTGDAAEAQGVIMETLKGVHEKINEADGKIIGGDISYYDLKLIQNQLLGGAAAIDYKPTHPWEKPFYQDIANDDVKGHEARQFWADMGLTLVAAAAIIAAPFTGGATAAFLVGFGIGIGAAKAGLKWEEYLDKSSVADATVKAELAVISKGEVTATLVEAIVETVSVFLDIFGARAATTVAKESTKALAAAEKGLKTELTEAAGKRALGETDKLAKEAAEKQALAQMSTVAERETKGAALAKKLGYPQAEPGYHWAEINGKPVYRRNPLRVEGPKLPEKIYDAETKTFKNVETKAASAESLEGELLTNAQKGKFGEQQANGYMKDKGFINRGSHDMPGPGGGKAKPQGIDGVYENTKPPPKWVVGEAKYGESGYGQTASGKQMSLPWTDARLDHAVGKKLADQIREEGFVRWELRVDVNGKVTKTEITW